MIHNLTLWVVVLKEIQMEFTKIIEEIDKIINLEVNLKHIYLKINSKIFKKTLIKG